MMSRTSLISMADNRGDHGVAVVKALLFTVVVVAHAASSSKPVLRSESSNDETSSREVRTHRHPTFSAGSSDLVVQNGWGKPLLHNWNDKNHTHEHEIDAAGLSESRKALDTVATPPDVNGAVWQDLSSWTVSASTSWSSDYLPANIKVGTGVVPSGRPWHDKGNGVNQWIKLDTGRFAKTVKAFRVKASTKYKVVGSWGGSAFKNFRWEYKLGQNDGGKAGEPWKLGLAGQGINQDCCDWQTFGSWIKARYFRLYMVDNWGYKDAAGVGGLTIQEMQVQVVPQPTSEPTAEPTAEPTPTPRANTSGLEASAYRTCVGSTSISLLASLMIVSLHRSS